MRRQIKIGSIIKQIRGVSYKPSDVRVAGTENAVALLRANNIQEAGLNFGDLVYIDRSKVKDEQYLRAGDILICSSSGSKIWLVKLRMFQRIFLFHLVHFARWLGLKP